MKRALRLRPTSLPDAPAPPPNQPPDQADPAHGSRRIGFTDAGEERQAPAPIIGKHLGVLDRPTIIAALARLAELLRERGVKGEICLLSGTAMVLAFNARPSAKDVDAIFEPVTVIRELAAVAASELNLPEDWLNDGAKVFISSKP
jgi:hypothetical protein